MNDQKNLLKDCYDKAVRAIAGRVITAENETEVRHILQIVAEKTKCELSGGDLYDLAKPYINENEMVYGLSCCTIYGDHCINLILREKNKPFDICDKNGIYCYVLNLTTIDYSELGRCWFEETYNGYRRIA